MWFVSPLGPLHTQAKGQDHEMVRALDYHPKVVPWVPGEITPPYILHTRAFGTYLLGGHLPCKIFYKVMVFYM